MESSPAPKSQTGDDNLGSSSPVRTSESLFTTQFGTQAPTTVRDSKKPENFQTASELLNILKTAQSVSLNRLNQGGSLAQRFEQPALGLPIKTTKSNLFSVENSLNSSASDLEVIQALDSQSRAKQSQSGNIVGEDGQAPKTPGVNIKNSLQRLAGGSTQILAKQKLSDQRPLDIPKDEANFFSGLKRIPKSFLKVPDDQREILSRENAWISLSHANEDNYADMPPETWRQLNDYHSVEAIHKRLAEHSFEGLVEAITDTAENEETEVFFEAESAGNMVIDMEEDRESDVSEEFMSWSNSPSPRPSSEHKSSPAPESVGETRAASPDLPPLNVKPSYEASSIPDESMEIDLLLSSKNSQARSTNHLRPSLAPMPSSSFAESDFDYAVPYTVEDGLEEDGSDMPEKTVLESPRNVRKVASVVQVKETPYPRRQISPLVKGVRMDNEDFDMVIPATFDDSTRNHRQISALPIPSIENLTDGVRQRKVPSGILASTKFHSSALENEDADDDSNDGIAESEREASAFLQVEEHSGRAGTYQNSDISNRSSDEITDLSRNITPADQKSTKSVISYSQEISPACASVHGQIIASRQNSIARSPHSIKSLERGSRETTSAEPPLKTVSFRKRGSEKMESSTHSNIESLVKRQRVLQLEKSDATDHPKALDPSELARMNRKAFYKQLDEVEAQAEQTLYDTYKTKYPSYKGSKGAFVRSLVYIEWLVITKTAPHPYLWDDFIRAGSSEYLDYVSNRQDSSEPLINGLEFYNNEVEFPSFTRRVVTPENIQEGLSMDPQKTEEARKRFFVQAKPNLDTLKLKSASEEPQEDDENMGEDVKDVEEEHEEDVGEEKEEVLRGEEEEDLEAENDEDLGTGDRKKLEEAFREEPSDEDDEEQGEDQEELWHRNTLAETRRWVIERSEAESVVMSSPRIVLPETPEHRKTTATGEFEASPTRARILPESAFKESTPFFKTISQIQKTGNRGTELNVASAPSPSKHDFKRTTMIVSVPSSPNDVQILKTPPRLSTTPRRPPAPSPILGAVSRDEGKKAKKLTKLEKWERYLQRQMESGNLPRRTAGSGSSTPQPAGALAGFKPARRSLPQNMRRGPDTQQWSFD